MNGCLWHENSRCFPGQMSMTPVGAAAGEEVIIHTFGAMGVDILTLLAFLTCMEHLFWVLFLSLAQRDDKDIGGLASGNSGVFCIQNCLLAFLHVWNWFSEISIALVSSNVMPKYLSSMS